jgi:2,3-bisphosphoglycerate-independent phosphoglycerate mutase
VCSTDLKIIFLVLDGLGGLQNPESGKTELETAQTPNMDRLVNQGNCGLTSPIGPGITPGSAPGHLGLFGYDPVKYRIGRGILEALGIDFNLEPGDIAARGNYCTISPSGMITDRRAGRITTEASTKLCRLLDGTEIEGIKIIVRPVKEHRFIVVLRGKGLKQEISDTDPQLLGVPAKTAEAIVPEGRLTAGVVNRFIALARQKLEGYYPANMILLRGFSLHPKLPSMNEVYKLKSAAIASYPMYRGLAKVVGMEVLPTGSTLNDEVTTLEQNYKAFDFFFLHIKGTDAAGEDGNFARKVSVIEDVDRSLSRMMLLKPDVLVIAGDHATPAIIKGHSWHEVPCIVYSKWCRPDRLGKFSETICRQGSLSHIPAAHLMPLAMAHALKLTKYGA